MTVNTDPKAINRALLATAYANAGKALLDLADALVEDGKTSVWPQDAPGAASFTELPPETSWTETDDWPDYADDPKTETPKPAGHAAVCPAHNTPYKDGRYGPFCPQQGTDPKWTNHRGYCELTPKNAAAYLRQKAKGAA